MTPSFQNGHAAEASNDSRPAIDMKPVIIAGAGPVGCAAALYLAQHGIPVTLIESQDSLPIDLRASTFHPPTLDMLDKIGITDKLKDQGLLVYDFQFRERRTNEVAKFRMNCLSGETNHPYRLQCEQYKMTMTAVEMLREYPHAKVIFGRSAVGFRENDDGVDLLVHGKDIEERIAGSYLIGADGANSRIRQSAGVLFEGLTYPEKFLVASTTFPFENHFEDLSWVNYVSDPEEWCVLLKTIKLWRVQFPAPVGMSEDELLSDEFIKDRLQRLVPNPKGYDIHHRTIYKVHQRVAENYRVGKKSLLVGDAAHINNPLGGMGMNGGIHDAINLCEKLCGIIFEGACEDEQFELYNRQRREICVRFVQRQTKENKAMMESTDENIQTERQRRLMTACSSPDLEKTFLMQSSMINSVRESYQIT